MDFTGTKLRGNAGRAFIWDPIGPERKLARYWESALGFVRANCKTEIERLKVQYEARPDHLGWLLYTFGKFGLPKAAIAAKAATLR